MRVLLLSLFGAALCALPAAAQTPAASPKPSAAKPAKPVSSAPSKPAAIPAPVVSTASDPVVFAVGEATLTKSQFDAFLATLPENVKAQVSQPGGKRQMAERMAEMKILAQEAERRKLQDKPDIKFQLELQRDGVLAGSLYQALLTDALPAEAALKAYYDSHASEYDQVKVKHILVRFQGSRVPLKPGQKDLTDAESLAKTQELRARILKGEDFAVIAKAESDDTGSGANGGDLGSFGHGRMVPEFEAAAFSLPLKQVSEPIKTAFGYHLIVVDEKGVKPFAEVKPELEKKQQQDAANKAMDTLKKSAKITIDPNYFGAEAPVAAPGSKPVPGTPKQ